MSTSKIHGMSSVPQDQDPSSIRDIVILGGSYGGVSVAHNLLKHTIPRLREHGRYRVLLVSKSSEILCRPACPRAMISDHFFDQDKLFVPISKAFEQYPAEHFDFLQGSASALDGEQRTVTVDLHSGSARIINYHALVIATGARTPSPLLGLNGDANELRQHWAGFRDSLKSATSICIAGGGPAGVEVAGELGEYLNGRAGWLRSGPEKPKVEINLVTSGATLLPVLRPAIAVRAERLLAAVGVSVMKNVRVVDVHAEQAGEGDVSTSDTIVSLSNGKKLSASLYIPTTGTEPNTDFVPTSLLDKDHRIITNAATLRVDDAGSMVYAVGDASSYARPAVHNILEAVPVLSANLKNDLLREAGLGDASRTESMKAFREDTTETQLVPIGTSKGVGAAKGWRLPSWAVWLIKGRDYWLWTTTRLWNGKQWD